MSQSTRLRNLSASVRSSTARMRDSPRAFNALTRFEPMKPAAPVTTVYTVRVLKLYIDSADFGRHERHAWRDGGKQLIADGARRGCDVVDRQSLAPEHDRATDCRLRCFGEIDRHQIHRHAARGANLLAANQDRRAVGCVARIAIGIAACDDTYAVCARRGVDAAVADALVGLYVLDGNDCALEGHHRREA